MLPNPYLLEAEKHERYRDALIQKRDALERGTRTYKQDYATLTHSIETAQKNAEKYRALAEEREAESA